MKGIENKTSYAALSYFSLFGSVGTLLCCALPSLLVLAGLGASVASMLSAAPWLVALSRHKPWTFGVSGILIAASFVNMYFVAPRIERQACSAENPNACETASRFSRVLLWISLVIYAAGFFVAFLLGPILTMLDRN
jgi:mercuric ion transport protein